MTREQRKFKEKMLQSVKARLAGPSLPAHLATLYAETAKRLACELAA